MNRQITRRNFLRMCAAGSGLTLTGCGVLQGIFPSNTPTPSSLFVEQPTAAVAQPAQAPTVTSAALGKASIILNAPDMNIRSLLENFERDNPGMSVQYITKRSAEAYQDLHNALKYGDNVPDLAIVSPGMIGDLSPLDGLTDLSMPPFDAGKLAGDMLEQAWAAGKLQGKQVAIPWALQPGVMIYRQDLLKKAGVDANPMTLGQRVKSWDDMLLLAQEYKQKQPNTFFFSAARSVFAFMVAQQGWGWVDGRKVLIQELGTAPAKLAARVRSLKLDAKLDMNGNYGLAIRDGEFVTLLSPINVVGQLASNFSTMTDTWRVLNLPGGSAITSALFLSIPAQAKSPDLAWKLARYLATNIDAQMSWLGDQGLVPSYTPSWENPLIEQGLPFLGGQQIYKIAIDIVKTMPKIRLSAYESDAYEVVDKEIVQVIEMGKDAEQAMQDAEQELMRKVGGDLVG